MSTQYLLKLYVDGMTPSALRAWRNLREISAELEGEDHFEIELIDISSDPGARSRENILVTPTLVRSLPLPIRRLIGDLSDREQVIAGLELLPLPATC